VADRKALRKHPCAIFPEGEAVNAGQPHRRRPAARPPRGPTLLLALLVLSLAPCKQDAGPAGKAHSTPPLAAIQLLLLSPTPTEKFADLGESDDPEADFDHPGIRLERLEGPAWESYWTSIDTYRENPSQEDGWYPYADLGRLPAGGGGRIGMRLVRGGHMAQFYADTGGFKLDGNGRNADALYLTLRYKDLNFDPALDRFWGTGTFPEEGPGVSVNGCADGGGCGGGAAWVKLGSLGGAHDFAWKSETLEIPPGGLAGVGVGEFKFRISPGLWGRSDLYGEIAIDWIRLSEADPKPPGAAFDAPYHSAAGFWPGVPMNPAFAGFAETGFLHEGEPFFPVGLFVITTHFYWESDENNYLTNARDTGFNLVVYNGWEAHSSSGGWFWGAKDATGIETFSIGDGPSVPYPARFLGLPDFLDLAEQYGLMAAPWWSTDMWRFHIRAAGLDAGDDSLYGTPASPYNGTFAGVVTAARQVVQENKDHPAILLWFLKDEADHLDEYWGSPVESVRWMYQAVTEADGAHPCLVNNMGWRPLMFRHYMGCFDIGAFDRYTSSFDGPASHDQVAEWAEEFRYQTGGGRMFMAILETEQLPGLGQFNDLDTIRTATYLALVHGAQGLLFFDDPGPNADLAVYSGCGDLCGPAWWDGLAALLSEVNTLAGTSLHNSVAETLGTVWGESHGGDLYPLQHAAWGDGATDNPRIHALFRRNLQTGERILIAVNAHGQETDATFTVAGLTPADGPVHVLFEGRTVPAGSGAFSDRFAGGERHVYRMPGGGS